MRIERFAFRDKDSGWELSPTEFFPDLTLLVGVSGAGKTQILRALQTLQRIAHNRKERENRRVDWELVCNVAGNRYCWQGEFETKTDPEDSATDTEGNGASLQHRPRFVRERVLEDDDELIDRQGPSIRFLGKETPKLPPSQSALSLLREEERIKPLYDGIGRIVYLDQAQPSGGNVFPRLGDACKRYPTLDEIRGSKFPTYIKLALVHENDKETFQKIIARFRNIFPQVEDVRVERVTWDAFADVPDLRIKEAGVVGWIPEARISSGMFRTLMHLSSVALWPDESVILVDEFENSLGVNCLDEITADVIRESRRMQFIITSHHPYIINNIPPRHWKVVTRKGSVVTTHNAAELGVGRSHHKAFLELINSELFQEGIARG